MIAAKRNYLGNPFRPDWSTPSTHLLYGHWVGATPDGRQAREMLGYGLDPLYGEAQSGLGLRVLSGAQLPYKAMNGGYASHFGINPGQFRGKTLGDKGLEFQRKVVAPLFADGPDGEPGPFYLYVNVTTPETLRQVLANRLHLADKVAWHLGNGQAQRVFELRQRNQHGNAVGEADDDGHRHKAHHVAQAQRPQQHQQHPGAGGGHQQPAYTVLLHDAIHDDDEGPGRPGNLHAGATQQRHQQPADDGRPQARLRWQAAGNRKSHGQR